MKEVDDNEFMKMVASGGDDSKKGENQAPAGETQKKKDTPPQLNHTQDYLNTFLGRAKDGEKSTVYLNKDLINQLKNIVANIGSDKATIGSYVEAILTEHFEQYKGEIIRLFNENVRKPFQ
jgi:Protein of unknown function (DUF3408).